MKKNQETWEIVITYAIIALIVWACINFINYKQQQTKRLYKAKHGYELTRDSLKEIKKRDTINTASRRYDLRSID
jgi:large-conductance mechanosensitive channel